MKSKSTLRAAILVGPIAALLATPAAHAAVVNWDGDTSVTWSDAANWDTAPTNDLTTDIANFNLATYGGDPVFAPDAGTTSISGLTIGALNGAMTLTTTALSIGGSGITIANGAGVFTVAGGVTLGAAQSWLNDSLSLFSTGAVTNGGFLLTIGGTGNSTVAGIIGGTGGLTKTGAGLLTLSGANTFSGQLTVQNGTLSIGTINNASANGTLGNSALAVILGNTGAQTGTLQYTGGNASSTKTFTLATGGTGAIEVTTGATNLTLSGAIGGSGNLTKTGPGILTLSNTGSTYSGQLTVANGTLSIGSINNVSSNGVLGNSALSVILGSSGNTGTLSYAGGNASSTKRFTFAAGGTGQINVSTGATTLTLSGLIDGSGGLSKTGAGTLTLSNNPNQFTGNTVITNGKVALGGQFALWQSAYDTTGSTGAIGLNVTGQANPWLGGLVGSVDLATAITGYGSVASLTLNPQTGSSVSYGGVIANGAAGMTLNKTGHGNQTLTGTNSYSGATTVWAGTLALSGASGTALNSAFTVRGGTLELDNSTNLVASRLTDGTALSLGSLTLKGFNTGGVQGETVGATTFAVGGKVTIINGTAVGDRTTLALGAVTRSAGAAINFVGTNGTLGGAGDTPNVTTTGTFPGGSNGILPWATVNGTTWAGTATTNSIVAYAAGFVDPTSAASNAANNAQLTGTGTIASAKSFNSLNVISSGAGQSLNLSANTGNLTLTSGAILKSGTDAYTISSSGSPLGNITAGAELIAHVDGGALTISAPLNAAILGIAKGGTGDIILSGTRAGTMSGNTSIAGGQLEFQGAGFILSGVVTGAGGLTVNLNAGQTLTMGNNSNSYAGPTIVKGGYLASPGFSSQGMPGGLGQTPSTNTSQIMSNLILNGGVFYASYVFNKDLGAGPGQVQILAGTSGFVQTAQSGGAVGYVLDGGRELVWGSTYFNPTVFVSTAQGNVTLNLANGFDLTGSTRTISVGDATYTGGTAISGFSGAIRTSSGTAGLTKTGPGEMLLSGASTYNGATTVSAGTLSFSGNANVASANPLGQSSAAAANLLLANGTTLKYSGAAASTDRSFTINGTAAGNGASLDASGSAAINFTSTATPAYGTVDQTRTLTLTGTNTNNNTLAANIANNGTAAVSVTKTGAGLWVLSGTSSYTGPTTLTAGTLSASAVSNLGDSTSNLVFNGGTFQPTGGTFLNFSSIGHTVIFNSGATVGLDISGTFTADQTFNQGTGGLTKAGVGTLIINSAHTYTGQTTVNAGTLRLDDSGVISAAPLFLNGGTFASNRTGTTTLGTNTPAIIGGTGGLANVSAGTLVLNAPTFHTGNTAATAGNITLSHQRAIQFSALDTTGAGTVTLSGTGSATPIIGGLSNSGTTRNLASVIDSSYASVTNLTLNPQSGSSFTYSGIIADGATGMHLTKTGAGTQTLTGNNTYTGTTFLNGGTLAVGSGSTIGKLSGTTDLNFNGGTLQFNRSTAADIDAINNAATVTVNSSSTFGVTSADAGGASANETVGAVTLNAGQMTFNWTNGGSSGTQMILTSLSRSGTASANFNSGFASNNSRWKVTGAGTTTAGQITGPWYTTGGNNAGFASTDYAVYSADFVAQAAIAGSAETAWTTAANAYTTSAGGTVTLTSTRTITALRNTGATTVLTLASGANLETYGLLNGVGTLLTVAPGTGGVLTTPSGGGNLYVNAGAGAITVNAPINNNGGNVTLVKNGSNTLTLGSTTSDYSGGTVINAGTVSIAANTNLGAAGTGVTFDGSASLSSSVDSTQVNLGSRPITLNSGAIATFIGGSRVNILVGGAVTGSGGVTVGNATFWQQYRFNSTANTFTGTITDSRGGNDGINNAILSFNSIADGAGYGNIILNGGNDSGIDYGSGAIAPLNLNNRQIILANNNTIFFNNASSQAVNIATDIGFSGTGARQIRFGITGRSGAGISTFSGKLTDNVGGAFTPTFNGGTWVVSNNNNYTGPTGVSAGTVTFSGNNTTTGQITVSGTASLTLSGNNSGMTSFVQLSTAGTTGPLLNINSATALGTGTLSFGGGAATDTVRIDNTSAGTVNVSTANALTLNRNFTFVGTQSLNLGTGTTTLGPASITGTNRSITITANTLTLGGTVAEAAANIGITKAGAGTLLLSGTGSTYTGSTVVSAGTMAGIGANAFGSTSGISIAGAGTLSLRGDSSTNFVKTSDSSPYTVSTSASGSTINVDQATIAGTGAKTMTIGSLGSSSTAAGYQVNFTGANNTSLNVGAVTGSISTVLATVTLNNTISSTGQLTLASYSSANTSGGETLILTGTGIGNISGAITPSATTLSLQKSNGTGTWVLSGSSSHTGTTVINGGTLQLGSGGITGSLSATGAITNNGNLTINRSNPFTQATDLNGKVIGGTGSFTQAGSGTTTLSLANTYDGTTTISAGTLVATNATALGTVTGSTTVTSGATLDVQADMTSSAEAISVGGTGVGSNGALITSTGTGTVAGTVTLTGNTSIGAGATGTLNINGTVTAGANTVTTLGTGVTNFGAGSTLTSLASLAVVDGTTNVNSALGTAGNAVVNVSDTVGGNPTKLRFGTVSQTLNSLTIGAGSTVIFTSGAASGAFSDGGGKAAGFGSPASSFGSGSAVVPEPGTIGLLLVGALGVLNRRRRQA